MKSELELHEMFIRFNVQAEVDQGAYLSALQQILPVLYPPNNAPPDDKACSIRDAIFGLLRQAALQSKYPPKTTMKFGTSGWRGILLEDFTAENVACVTQALVDVVCNPELFSTLGVKSLESLKNQGCVLAHDTRLLGPEFLCIAARILRAHGLAVHVLEIATTPEVSAALGQLQAAFSINFTPSHNPFTYQGYKFNPADGGPAPASLTAPVARRANEILLGDRAFKTISEEEFHEQEARADGVQRHDPVALYKMRLRTQLPWFNLDHLVDRINSSDLQIFVDNGFGATSHKYEQLLAGLVPGKLITFNGGQDFLFGGKNREPSVENFRFLQKSMASSCNRFTVGVMNDGDGDRFVGGGPKAVLVMNKFGPLVVRYLTQMKNVQGDVTRSVMTSHLADAALRRYLPERALHETRVGFQYMREFIPLSVNSWEESDGMSPKNWLLDKDGLLAALLLISMVIDYQAPPEVLLETMELELGSYFFERSKVGGTLAGASLEQALSSRFGHLEPDSTLEIEGRSFVVERRSALDGTKIVFREGWWFGVRASGTEPVVRPYVETFASAGASFAEKNDAQEWQHKILRWLVREVAAVTGG